MKFNCSFNEWFPFLSKNSIEAVALPIPIEVIEYLEHGTFRLPIEAIAPSTSNESSWSDGTCLLDNDEEPQEKEKHLDNRVVDSESGLPSFPEFSSKINQVLKTFGAVFVKLNWSAPLDAAWIAPTKTLRCTTLEEIYLLLKSSDRVAADLNHLELLKTTKVTLQPYLVLKRWQEITPCTEFRCYVINGISQRDLSQYYQYIESARYSIRQEIKSLFNEHIRKSFVSCKDYTFDVIYHGKGRVQIIDFGPYFPEETTALLFKHNELTGSINDPPELRYLGENITMQPNVARYFGVPRDIEAFYQSDNLLSTMDIIRREVRNQNENSLAD
ncbi:cell division cycle protein 123 homolog isoform X2 [Athalia rosae]|uniref:cell division cycle protein 123 homolog isoform X2 n=1 Tax=Athalia rosae TaxID=37344 RepID=UPI002033BACA|nr:cell division cycle protein 123 homolog isoform X2 [Athalia rosae]